MPNDPPAPGGLPDWSSARTRIATNDFVVSIAYSRISRSRTTGLAIAPLARATATNRSYRGWLIAPAPIEPMATRSYISIAVAWRHPLLISPINQSAGIRTSVKNTSLK